ncbi:sulfatase-like hydrolase/transferase [Clostridium sp. CCUG 7971]|uniref:sulfatase-like hydrolase/transferase n=1 Tax=Clostridium sp. CCUG 7971 TaxID=2811414 RepID=UPI001ABB87AE|nr:sulfatase-like hydrolase/transferase [Clostridium sp. CCUG 7971]MBO3445241.1 sulfatase-like hydrolase/transferase [Clostridium sp. CCUG 7971]
MKKPNIIVFFSDQQRFDTVGCYGQKLDITPNLDYMASEGVKFENAFTCQPVCGPARSCMQTGKYATQTECFINDIGLKEDETTIAKLLSEEGYETAYVGKWHLASTKDECDFSTSPVPENKRGGYKDYWMASDVLEFTSHGYDGYVFNKDMEKIEFEGYRADKITDFALDYLENRNKEKPFLLFLSHIEPHHQNDRKIYEGPEGSKDKFKEYILPQDLKSIEGDYKENYPDYLGCCKSLDNNLGRIREKLKDLDIDKNTVVIYTSDHGCHFKTKNKNLPKGGADDYKRSFYENTIRVPLVAYGPGFEGGKVIHELSSLIDIPKTIIDIAMGSKPEFMEGVSLLDLVHNKTNRDDVFIQISESYVGRALRTKKYKYCIIDPNKHPYEDSYSLEYEECYLYDLEKDPLEKVNLIDHRGYEDIKEELRLRIKEYIKNIEHIDIKITNKK